MAALKAVQKARWERSENCVFVELKKRFLSS